MPFTATILTIHPEAFPGILSTGVVGRGLREERWHLNAINIRDFAEDNHRSVDDTPYGGGAGMVLRADILGKTIDSLENKTNLFYLSPRGKPITQQWCMEQSQQQSITLLCGRYEGVDQRVLDHYNIQEISIGDYVLSGGEVAAMVTLDAIIRLIPGIFGNADSGEEESFSNNLLEYPHYTRPLEWQQKEVPEVLRSGNHQAIKQWRDKQSCAITRAQRPDLWAQYMKNQ